MGPTDPYVRAHMPKPQQVLQPPQLAAIQAKVAEHSLDVCAGRVMVRCVDGRCWSSEAMKGMDGPICDAIPPHPTHHHHHDAHTQVFVDGVYRPELSLLGNVTGAEPWRAGSIHGFADDPELQVRMRVLCM